ncbi:MAG: type II toxin-antitoxin system YafQ family toxin [Oscillospiraceae bacterium]|nr:type II toxin-antitoxin system YafQ family toxin [Oscillospiraceae bacterium]
MYKISPTKQFEKSLKRLSSKEQKSVATKLLLLAQNPMHPSLRTKKIKGIDNTFECSVNMDIRIIWFYEGDKIIVLLDIGHHDILDRL